MWQGSQLRATEGRQVVLMLGTLDWPPACRGGLCCDVVYMSCGFIVRIHIYVLGVKQSHSGRRTRLNLVL
jgi:hypothetical protein